MDFGQVVYQLGKRYRKELQNCPEVEFPYFTGLLSDLVGDSHLNTLPELEGEYVIDFRDGNGSHHFIRVYFDEGTFEAQGTPGTTGLFNISTNTYQD